MLITISFFSTRYNKVEGADLSMKIYAGRKRSEYPPIPVKPVNHSDQIFFCPSFELLSDSEATKKSDFMK